MPIARPAFPPISGANFQRGFRTSRPRCGRCVDRQRLRQTAVTRHSPAVAAPSAAPKHTTYLRPSCRITTLRTQKRLDNGQ